MLNENLIATLEVSLRQTRNAQNRLLGRLREVETEADSLRQEIQAMENSAAQTEQAIYSLLATMGSSNQTWKIEKKVQYENPPQQYENPQPQYDKPQQQYENQQQQQQQYENQSQYEDDNYNMPPEPRRYNRTNKVEPITPPPNYRNNPVTYLNNNQRNVPSISPKLEAISQRFADRTITQACTLLLRESNSALHVNDLYNLLVAGGFEFKGNNPTISIAVSLNRNRRFSKVAPGTFDLVMRDASSKAAS